MPKPGSLTVRRNGHTLVVTIAANGVRYFACDSFPATSQFDGATDPTAAPDAFERLADETPERTVTPTQET